MERRDQPRIGAATEGRELVTWPDTYSVLVASPFPRRTNPPERYTVIASNPIAKFASQNARSWTFSRRCTPPTMRWAGEG